MSHSVVTTSWDDGDPLDLKLADLLQPKQIPATFYVPVRASFRPEVLSPSQLRSLSDSGFEIGSHGVTETPLKGLSNGALRSQIAPCRPALEDIVGREVRMFCYVRGSYNREAIRIVEQAGFIGARTVQMLRTSNDFDAFEMPTTLQCFPHPRSTYFKNALRAAKVEGLNACFRRVTDLTSWVQLGRKLFDSVQERGGIWHLYGHSWEIEKRNLWKDLAELLDYVGNRPGVSYMTNGEVVGRRLGRTATATAPAQMPEITVPGARVAEVDEPSKTVEAGR